MKKENTNLLSIIKVLEKLYPHPECALHYTTPIQFLVAVILSAQCTDKRVNEVTKTLFKKYKTVGDFAQAVPAEFETEIFSTGFYRAKTKNILAAAQAIQDEFNGKVPKTMRELITVPGVGRKTANVVLGELYRTAEGIAVDTHVIRLSRLFGFTKHNDAIKIEQDLMQIVAQKDWVNFSHMIILYGREYCTAHCKHIDCPLAQFAKGGEKSSIERDKQQEESIMKSEPIVATVVYLTRNRAGITHFCLAQKKQNIHKDNGEALTNSQKWNGYGGKKEKSDTSVSQCALRELYDESGVKATEADLCKVGQIQFFWPQNTTQVCDMDVTFFLVEKYEGEPHETREMGMPKFFSLDDAPFDAMMPADKLILSVIMTNRNIEGKIFFKKNSASETMIKMTTIAVNDRP